MRLWLSQIMTYERALMSEIRLNLAGPPAGLGRRLLVGRQTSGRPVGDPGPDPNWLGSGEEPPNSFIPNSASVIALGW